MAEAGIHLVKVPLRADRFVETAERRAIRVSHLDDGYVAHCILRELWQENAPTPFVLRGRGRTIDAWGYTRSDASALAAHAREHGDPSLLAVLDDLTTIASKPMPTFPANRRVGFLLRVCPVVRLSKAHAGHRAGAEVDAFLAKCFSVASDVLVSREEVYRDWLARRLGNTERSGVSLERVALAGLARERLIRRTHGKPRAARRLERPAVRFEGELVVHDGARFLATLAHGVGRHKAFGFGALIVVQPGMTHPHG